MSATVNSNPSVENNPNFNPPAGLSVSSIPPTATQSSVTLGPLHGAFPNGIRITERTMKDASWPTDLILDLGKANWFEWSRTLNLSVRQCGLRPWLEGTLPCPDPTLSADAHYVWTQNDDTLSAFMLQRVSPADMDHTNACTNAHDLFECLRILHKNQGTYTQISLLMKALELRFSYDTPLRDKLADARNYYRRITPMGNIKDDDIFTAILLHMMSGDFIHLQQSVQNITHLPNFNSEMIIKRILDEDTLIRRRLGQPTNPNNPVPLPNQSAFAAQTRQRGPKMSRYCDTARDSSALSR
ncbi:hypothetical protein F5888DRAFT_1634505 [Russula emetica]|nr:hypothetical protein F5888DRAFT_1634505 [Russula emetica]